MILRNIFTNDGHNNLYRKCSVWFAENLKYKLHILSNLQFDKTQVLLLKIYSYSRVECVQPCFSCKLRRDCTVSEKLLRTVISAGLFQFVFQIRGYHNAYTSYSFFVIIVSQIWAKSPYNWRPRQDANNFLLFLYILLLLLFFEAILQSLKLFFEYYLQIWWMFSWIIVFIV